MSEAKRYYLDDYGVLIEHPAGEYVLHSDYARLKAEVERLTERLNRHLEINDELDARCIRLRKAGDAVSLCLEAFWKGKPYDTSTNIECFDAWNAAKEGKQS